MAVSVSLINMKGGVGKTTLAMQLAQAADLEGFRVLAIDLDPQANLSQVMMEPLRYREFLRKNDPTLADLLQGYRSTGSSAQSPRQVEVGDVICKGVGFKYQSRLDLIPSRLELSRILRRPEGVEHRLAIGISKVESMYDLVIIDCAPTESVLTDVAYFASRFLIVPVKPEFMAAVGLPLLARSLNEFRDRNRDHALDIAGIVFNQSTYSVSKEGMTSMEEVKGIASQNDWRVCENQMNYSAAYAKAAREGRPLQYTSYVRQTSVSQFRRLKDEIFAALNLTRRQA